jgi:hypothetical protein
MAGQAADAEASAVAKALEDAVRGQAGPSLPWVDCGEGRACGANDHPTSLKLRRT